MTSEDRAAGAGQPGTVRGSRALDILAKLSRAVRPKAPEAPPTTEDFERLLYRFEREYTVAYGTCVWKSTWAEILAMSQRLFVDKGDLCEFYALDYAADLVLARNIEGVDETLRGCLDRGGYNTLASITRNYIKSSREKHWLTATALSRLLAVVEAWSPPETTPRQRAQRALAVVSEALGKPLDDDPPIQCLKQLLADHDYIERRERYEREKAGDRRSDSAGACF